MDDCVQYTKGCLSIILMIERYRSRMVIWLGVSGAASWLHIRS